jgi:uncharacterized protein
VAKKKKNIGGSLQDQLKQAGLVTDKQIRKANKGMHRQEMRVKKGVEVDEARLEVQQAQALKQAKDREKNEQIRIAAEKKALAAQVKQLIALNSQRQVGDIEYNFTEQNKVKKLFVSALNKTQLNKGHLAIVKHDDNYDLVPEKVARRIMDRLDGVVLYLYDRTQDEIDEDDPYKDFQIPDDLEW